jgi:hypothetical protein
MTWSSRFAGHRPGIDGPSGVFLDANGAAADVLAQPAMAFLRDDEAQLAAPRLFTSGAEVPLLQLPEGLTAWDGHVFVGTYNYVHPSDSRIFVFDSRTGALEHTIGGTAGQELVSAGPILGLTIDPHTGDLLAAANGIGDILRIENPASDHPTVIDPALIVLKEPRVGPAWPV